MDKIANYTISSLESLRTLPELEFAQFTLNSRMFPSKRRAAYNLSQMKPYHNAKIVVHYDYIYIIARYNLFNKEVQQAIIKEIDSIMKYSESTIDNEVIGLIMHTDFPLRRQVYQAKNMSSSMLKTIYNGGLWDFTEILKCYNTNVLNGTLENVLHDSFNKFYSDLKAIRSTFPFKIFIENTTKVPLDGYNGFTPGSTDYINEYLKNNPEKQDMFGMCLDTEHAYAVKGPYNKRWIWDCEILVHLNPVPVGVSPGSLKDQHSATTLFECSINTYDYYEDLMKYLNDNKIPFIRECKNEAMLREWESLKERNLITKE